MVVLSRADKGRRLVAYLAARTGIINLRYVPQEFRIDIDYPHHIKLSTDRKSERFYQYIYEIPTPMGVVIRFDGTIGDIEDAMVGMKIGTYAALLEAYVEREREKNAT